MSRFFVSFRMHNSGWAIVAYCLAFGLWRFGWSLGIPTGILLLAILLVHEVGHMLVAISLGVPVREFGLRLVGAYNRRAYADRRRDEIFIAAAGPLTNIVLTVPLSYIPTIGSQLALCSFVLGLVNLLPIPSSDGGRILRNLLPSKNPDRDPAWSVPQ